MATAAAKAARVVISRVNVGSAGAAAATKPARTVPRRLHTTSDKSNCLCNNNGEMLHEGDMCVKKCEFETAMHDQKNHIKDLLHKQNMKIIKLQNELEIHKADMEVMRHNMKCDIVKGQTTILKGGIIAILGLGIAATLLSDPATS